jgi:hypothetical protein
MRDTFGLYDTLDRVFSGDRESALTLNAFLKALEGRSYPFAIAALNLPNCVPSGLPWISAMTGLPMLFLLAQFFAGRPVPSLPNFIGRRGILRGKLQRFLVRARRHINWLENNVHVRHEWWITGLPRRALLLAWSIDIVILALPIPLDNFFPALAILFFCLALIEDDGVMAMLGWFMTGVTAAWTVFILTIGHAAIMAILRTLLA